MAVTVINPNFPFGNQFKNTEEIIDGAGSFTNEDKANASETDLYVSDVVTFVASGDDVQSSLVTVASGMPPGVGYNDQGNGVLNLEGTPSNDIIPTFDISIYDNDEPSVGTGGTPSNYKLGDQVNIYQRFDVTVTSTHIASDNITLPLYVIKDWDEERQNLLNKINSEYPE